MDSLSGHGRRQAGFGRSRYRWRGICQFGELDGAGVGESYQVRAMAFDKLAVSLGVPEKSLSDAVKTNTLVVKRVK